MRRISTGVSYGLGMESEVNALCKIVCLGKNHFASDQSFTQEVKDTIQRMGLMRIAGNVWACPSAKDFWKVKGDKIIRLTAIEVDNGDKLSETLKPDEAENFLTAALADLTW